MDSNGKVDFRELLSALLMLHQAGNAKERAKLLFESTDLDGDGTSCLIVVLHSAQLK